MIGAARVPRQRSAQEKVIANVNASTEPGRSRRMEIDRGVRPRDDSVGGKGQNSLESFVYLVEG